MRTAYGREMEEDGKDSKHRLAITTRANRPEATIAFTHQVVPNSRAILLMIGASRSMNPAPSRKKWRLHIGETPFRLRPVIRRIMYQLKQIRNPPMPRMAAGRPRSF